MELSDLEVFQVRTTEPDKILEKNHYLGYVPPGAKFRFLLLYKLKRVGACMVGRPSSRYEDDGKTLELTRFWTSDETPKNTETWFLARVREKLPDEYDSILAYSSQGQNHDGTIYRADNWELERKTREGDTWESLSKEERRDVDPSQKLKFRRSLS